ncbi:glycosyltransferase family 4 protein [Robertmurraya sp. FSL R5-0851]|uniref:glycosyltransferase family 4 protein n=1 Tax=Robertmurraya sp. FSL R5-0851 TaxID=2921584 RepID=UPI0030F9E4F4
MKRKVLFCATVDYHFSAFHLPYLKWFKEQGWDVHVAASGTIELPFVDEKFNLPIQRSPFHRKNIAAYNQLKEVIDRNGYQLIHCHTPMGGVLARLAARSARQKGTKVIYTAHGFHFCKGAPIPNWMVYYPIERVLSYLTDSLITINEEDYKLATSHQFKAKQIEHVHGVGVDTERFTPVSNFHKEVLRAEHRYDNDAFLMFYAAEFNANKNQQLLIHALAHVKEHIPKARLLLAGEGPLLEQSKQLSEQLDVISMIDFLGYRRDIESLLKMSDIVVASSKREGLPVNIMEAMACGLPIISSVNRGHIELVSDGVNGFTVVNDNFQDFGLKILKLYNSVDMREKMGAASVKLVKKFSLDQVSTEIKEVYSNYIAEESREAESKYNRAYI